MIHAARRRQDSGACSLRLICQSGMNVTRTNHLRSFVELIPCLW